MHGKLQARIRFGNFEMSPQLIAQENDVQNSQEALVRNDPLGM